MSSSATPLPEIASKSINWSIALSVLLILAGFFALLVPFISGIGITVFIGWAMVISGIFHFVFAFKSHTTGSVLWEILLGALYVFSGFYLISHPALSGLLPHSPFSSSSTSSSRASSNSSTPFKYVPAPAPDGSSSTESSPSSSPS